MWLCIGLLKRFFTGGENQARTSEKMMVSFFVKIVHCEITFPADKKIFTSNDYAAIQRN